MRAKPYFTTITGPANAETFRRGARLLQTRGPVQIYHREDGSYLRLTAERNGYKVELFRPIAGGCGC
jgi:hypothetical protein